MITDPHLLFQFVSALPQHKGLKLHTRLLRANKNYNYFWTKNKDHVKKIFTHVEKTLFCTKYYTCNLLHRKNGPAVEYVHGRQEWYKWGKLHRTNCPAVEYKYIPDNKEWYKGGKLHRTNGPAVEYTNGTKEWWKNGIRYRKDGPAIEYGDGRKEWYNLSGEKYDRIHQDYYTFLYENNMLDKIHTKIPDDTRTIFDEIRNSQIRIKQELGEMYMISDVISSFWKVYKNLPKEN